ncbi:fumarylacetoacetate hydrolase family protein [Pasteurellaceae bacterium HPA106]|uniref:fumarylacetoacetate hydrolase family protein n=1 Tax=Spirabiliibacterium pneumoniae TaxID=221400 RepID=UPI001AAC74AC|nr:fumarylacetoacetate hydrolase family protein [Spirabiliibacterium pneumoniae]MBE2896606.1 fumarylacetoacetate hydrolase family protein [Spirabiliibacterium pneumoniae]
MYQHRDIKGSTLDLPAGKVVCVGRNYHEHIKELNNPVPSSPLLFIKPQTALCCLQNPILIPKTLGRVEHELEIAALIGKDLTQASAEEAKSAVCAFAVALDLTLRDVQECCKANAHPWEIAKGFDNACPVSPFVPVGQFSDWTAIDFSLQVNGMLRQAGNSQHMLVDIPHLISYASQFFTLQKGDIMLTGTPQGVGELRLGDKLELHLGEHCFHTEVI